MEQLFEDYLERLSVIHSEFETTIAGLPQEALDWVPGADMTALGALIVHVSEAMRYWVGEVAAGINANRDREAEFVTHGRSEAELRQMLADVRTLVREVLDTFTLEHLAQECIVPHTGQQYTIGRALLRSFEHTALHLGQAQVTRQLWDQTIMTDFDFLSDTPTPAEHPTRKPGLGLGNIVLLIGVLAVAGVFGFALLQRQQTQPTSGPAPDFTLTTMDGSQIRLSDLNGKVVVINFWASWCGPCRDEAAALQNVWDQYKDKGVVVLGVAWTDTVDGARSFMAEFGQNYPNGLDLGTKIADLYNIQGVPETFVIDKKGNVSEFIIAGVNQSSLSATLDKLLGAA